MASSPLLFFVTVFIALLMSMCEAGACRQAHYQKGASHIAYTTVTGYFLQDDPATDASTFDYTKTNFGLINRTYETDDDLTVTKKTQWERFERFVRSLNDKAPPNVKYKVLFLGRHGEGYHNVAEAFYGTPAWDCYWSELDGNGTSTWADARVTDKGIAQALVAHEFWKEMLEKQKIPAPEAYYTSPLDRCLSTANLTFSGLALPEQRPFVPVVKELLREALGIHTCDRRSTRSYIRENYPTYVIEDGFTENDELWSPTLRESSSAQVARLKVLLDDIFTNDDNTFVSFTSHSGSIGSILTAIGHRKFALATGTVIPVLVKGTTVNGNAPPSSIASSTPAPTCTVDPTPTPTPQ